MENTDIVKLEQKTVPMLNKNAKAAIEYANNLVVDSDEASAKADSAIRRIKEQREVGDNTRKFFTDPLNDQVKKINSMFMPVVKALDEATKIISGKMGAYQMKLQADADAKKAKVEADLAAGKIKNVETAVKKIENVKEPVKTVRTETGTTTFRDVPKVVIVDASKLPPEFLMPDLKKIEVVALANHKTNLAQIPGVEVKIEKVPTFRR